jgi:undecaprenyl diphosphate synthase
MCMNRPVVDPVFSSIELESLDPGHIPHHIAIIPDGNRRWATSNMLPTETGHKAGYEGVVKIVRAAKEMGIKVITLYAFSTENWKRPGQEVQSLMQLTQQYLASYQQKLIEENIRLSAIGNLEMLPLPVKVILNETMRRTQHCTGFDLVLGINYGGRNELVRAIVKIINEKIDPKLITEQMVSEHLDTKSWPDPELVIRTSGEKRLSNFLLWQSSYSEVYTESVSWPDFSPQHLLQAVRDYQKRERRLGGRA